MGALDASNDLGAVMIEAPTHHRSPGPPPCGARVLPTRVAGCFSRRGEKRGGMLTPHHTRRTRLLFPLLRTAPWAKTPVATSTGHPSTPVSLALTGGFRVGFELGGEVVAHADETALAAPVTVAWQYAADNLHHAARADERSPFSTVPLPHAPLGAEAALVTSFDTCATSWLAHPVTAQLLLDFCGQQLGHRYRVFFAPSDGSLIATTTAALPAVSRIATTIYRRTTRRISPAPFVITGGWPYPLDPHATELSPQDAFPRHTRTPIDYLSPATIEAVYG